MSAPTSVSDDVLERHNDVVHLASPAQLAQTALRQLEVGIAIVDAKGVVVEWNDRLSALLRCSRDDAIGEPFVLLVDDDKRSSVRRKLKSALTLGQTAFFSHESYGHLVQVDVQRSLGHAVDAMKQDATFSPLLADDGTVIGACISVNDVTPQHLVQQALEQANAQLRYDIGRDPLTGAFNRGYLMSQLTKTAAASRRHHQPACVLLLDVDHFKMLNDTEGHLAGDAALVHLAGCLVDAVREEDVVARYGGEEFCVLLPNTDVDGAMVTAERVRAAVEDMQVPFEERTLRLTVSVGVALLDVDDSDANDDGVERSLKAADAALYDAKRTGRNRVRRA